MAHGDEGVSERIRTMVNLIPESVAEIRNRRPRQAGRRRTHVSSTDQVGRVRVVTTESKGKGNKRIRIELLDDDAGGHG